MTHKAPGALLALIAALALAGCATKPSTHSELAPSEAITAIALDQDPDARFIDIGGITTTITTTSEAFPGIVNTAEAYCTERGGKVSRWLDRRGAFNCENMPGGTAFSLTYKGEYFTDFNQIEVIESDEETEMLFKLMLQSYGYRSQEEIMAERAAQADAAAERKRQQELQQRASRIENRDLVAYTGASVCLTKPHFMDSSAIYIGTVEQVAGDKIKVFWERAVIAGAPGLSPGGFKQHSTWLNYWDLDPCE